MKEETIKERDKGESKTKKEWRKRGNKVERKGKETG